MQGMLDRVVRVFWIVFCILLGFYLVVTVGAGKNQYLDPDIVRLKLKRGMTVEEVCYVLELDVSDVESRLSRSTQGSVVQVSFPGRITSYLHREEAIYLTFGPDLRLRSAWVEVYWRTQEWGGEVPLGP